MFAKQVMISKCFSLSPSSLSFIAVEPIDTYCVLISSKVVYFLKPGEFVDREAIFLEVKYDDLYHCLVSKDHWKVYVQLTKKSERTSSGIAMPGPSQQKPMVRLPQPYKNSSIVLMNYGLNNCIIISFIYAHSSL